MKLTIFILTAGLFVSATGLAEEQKPVKSALQTATVFFQGAELTHKASAVLSKGENEVSIEGLSPSIDRNSLKISATDGAVVTSYEYSVNHLNPKQASPVEKKLQDSITVYKKQIKDADVKLETNKDLQGLLQANKSIAGAQTGLSVAELVKMMDYYQTKSVELQNEKSSLEDLQQRASERIAVLQKQLALESLKNTKTSGVLKLTLTAPVAGTSAFTISYYTTSASWTPYYDINVAGVGKPITMASKAKVKQTTGLDWEKVKLTLSTSMPSKGKTAPLFEAWRLDFQDYLPVSAALKGRVAGIVAQNMYSYDAAEVAEEAPSNKIMIRGNSSISSDHQPLYIVDGQVISSDEATKINSDMFKSMEVLTDAKATAIYGSRGANGVIVISLKSSMDDFVSRDENQLNMTYNIDLPYTIAGNGKEQSIDLQTLEVPAEFSYYSAPKLDAETFLLAEIGNWEKLGLLSGKANVTYDGTYIGQTSIDVNSTFAKLPLTLGTDKRVSVKREKLQDFSSKKFLGSDAKQEFVYKIIVKNNQNQPVKVVLKDQYPLSAQKDIEIELLKETTPADHKNEDVGVLVWEFELKPGETREFKTAYSVKYPKGKTLNW
jgi:TonB-dependent SusC/RagA subfamily outer membrane receptor